MDRRLPDPWEDKCPKARDLLPSDLQYLLECVQFVEHLSGWECEFCQSLWKQLWYGRRLSLKQEEILDRGLIRKLWMGDTRLWGEDLPPQPLAHTYPHPPSLRVRYQVTRVMIERAQFLCMDDLTDMLIDDRNRILDIMHAKSWVPPF